MQGETPTQPSRSGADRKHSTLMQLFLTRRDMTLITLLQFLSFAEILKLAMVNRWLRWIIDPISCKDPEFNEFGKGSGSVVVGDKAKLEGDGSRKYLHLKRIAAIQLLSNGENLSSLEIDAIFWGEIR